MAAGLLRGVGAVAVLRELLAVGRASFPAGGVAGWSAGGAGARGKAPMQVRERQLVGSWVSSAAVTYHDCFAAVLAYKRARLW